MTPKVYICTNIDICVVNIRSHIHNICKHTRTHCDTCLCICGAQASSSCTAPQWPMGGPPDAEELLSRAEDSLAALATAVAVLSDALHRPRTAPAPAPALVPRQRSGGGCWGASRPCPGNRRALQPTGVPPGRLCGCLTPADFHCRKLSASPALPTCQVTFS